MAPNAPRAVEGRLSWLLRGAPVLVVTGPRGAGVRDLTSSLPELRSWQVGSLDDLTFRAAFAADPVGRLTSASWVIHEAHLWPELWEHVRSSVERRGRVPGQLVLTSPIDLKVDLGRADRLGSRAAFLQVGPRTRRERSGRGEHGRWTEFFRVGEEKWGSAAEWGTGERTDWAVEVTASGLATGSWSESLSRTLREDVPAAFGVVAPEKLMVLLAAACRRTGERLNRAALARAAGVPRPTAHRHLDLLERVHALRFLPAYVAKGDPRPVRTPRAHVSDPALAIELTGADRPERGHLEALLLNDLVTWRSSDPWPPQLYHWATHGGAEVSFVLERNGRFVPVGVSLSEQPLAREAKGIRAFLDRMGTLAPGGLLLHVGDEARRLAPGVWAVPWWRVV